jgi:hypothetical protein
MGRQRDRREREGEKREGGRGRDLNSKIRVNNGIGRSMGENGYSMQTGVALLRQN